MNKIPLKIKSLKDSSIHDIWKLVVSVEEVSVWSHSWYGRHVIGQDCEFIIEE